MSNIVQLDDYRRRRQQQREFNPWGLLLYSPAALWAGLVLMALRELSK